ncbi:MAG: VCBS repeat-containing protein, partial [Nitrospinota bacterium]
MFRNISLTMAVAAFLIILPRNVLSDQGEGHIHVGRSPHALVLADVNKDEKLDIIVAASAGEQIDVLLGDGKGGISRATSIQVGRGPGWVVMGDVDGNGTLDMVSAETGAGQVTILYGDGNGSFPRR